jgi:dihydroorotase/N-acyl-D-amino-acid deacylase
MFDVLIRGGRIVDGTGNPWFHGDIAIRGDRIAAIGNLTGVRAATVIDATSFVVAPAFIDIHSHSDRGIGEGSNFEHAIRQGLGTLMAGQDGGSPIPLAPALTDIEQRKLPVNFGFFAGHNSIRREVMGLVNRKATPAEIAQMQQFARDSMRAGAFGLSTGLFYVPGNFAATEEVVEIARAVGELGGIYISHMRDEAAGVRDSVRETIRVGEEGRLPTQITHHKIMGKANWGASRDTLRLVEEARQRGVDVTIDQYPYTASHTNSSALLPQWSLAGGREALAERLVQPETRARIKAEVERRIREDRGGGDPARVQFARCTFDQTLDGKTLAEATARSGREPSIPNAAEMLMEIQAKGGCSTIYHAIDEEDLRRIMRSPWTMIASDGEAPTPGVGSPHPRAYGTFPRVLGRYVREHSVLTLEDAIRRMSSMPAWRLGLQDRGVLRLNMFADVVIFDEQLVTDRSEYARPHQLSEGVRHLLINGKLVLRNGQLTSERPGRVLRGPAYRTSP